MQKSHFLAVSTGIVALGAVGGVFLKSSGLASAGPASASDSPRAACGAHACYQLLEGQDRAVRLPYAGQLLL